jgi:regulation of enolase protein 1 (concanavalin A-like superfamily)
MRCRHARGQNRTLLIWLLLSVFNAGRLPAQSPSSLPAPWSAQDVGNTAIAGVSSFDQGQFTITATGSDVAGRNDQFHFVYQQISGDVDISARVDSVTTADPGSKAGVMIRASLDSSAAYGFAFASAAEGVAYRHRARSYGQSYTTAGPASAPPQWVRLMRSGSRITAYSSPDGSTWAVIGRSTVALGDTVYVGLAITSRDATTSTTALVSDVNVLPVALPSPQQATDIGAPATAGSAAYSRGVYTHYAEGVDIGGSSDQFNFIYQAISGDAEVVAHVSSISAASGSAKSGVMIRETLATDARHAFTFATPGSGLGFDRRIDPGGTTAHTEGPPSATPAWLRLVRTGPQLDAFSSTDGTTWSPIGSDVVPMADTVYVGIATTSHDSRTATDAVLDNFVVKAVGQTNQPPIVNLTGPADGTTFTVGTAVPVSADVTDADGTVSRVDFFAGSTPIGTATSAPYSVTWSPGSAGTYSLSAVAVDDSGATTTSAPAGVSVNPAVNGPPVVALTAPASGATYTAPAVIALSATASDPENALARVDFYSGETLIGSSSTAPYLFTWAAVPAGTYNLHAVAIDAAGASATSATMAVTVAALPAPLPAPLPTGVAFHASADHDTGVSSYQLRIFAAGSDPGAATPLVTSDLGKPTPDANGDITVDRAALFSALTPGSYVAAVTAVAAGGSSTSTGVTFAR